MHNIKCTSLFDKIEKLASIQSNAYDRVGTISIVMLLLK